MMDNILLRVAFLLLTGSLAVSVGAGCHFQSSESHTSSASSAVEGDGAVGSDLIKAHQVFREGDLRAALAYTDTAALGDSNLADVYFLRGRIFSRLKRYDKAKKAYRKTLSLNPSFQGAWLNIGNNFLRRGQFVDALEHYRREKERYPTANLFLHIAQAYNHLGKVDSAIFAYKKALARDDSFAPAHAWLGQLYKKEGSLQQAVTHTQQAVALDSSDLKYRYFLGSLLLKVNQVEAAVQQLQRVINEKPWHYPAHYNLGQAFTRMGRHEEAKQHLVKSDSLEQWQATIDRLQALAADHSNQPQRWIQLAEAFQKVQRFDRAMEAYKIALSLAPQSVVIRNNMATLMLAQNDTSRALAWYKGILRKDSTAANVWLNLGVVYAQRGKRKAALEAWRQALRYEPGHSTAKTYISVLLDR